MSESVAAVEYSASDHWVNERGYDILVTSGSIILDQETGVARCSEHKDIELLFDVMNNARTCSHCGTAALILLTSIA